MRVGIDQLFISQLRPPGGKLPAPDIQLIEQARLYGLDTLPTIKARVDNTGGFEILSGLLTWRTAQALRIDDVEIEQLHVDDAAAKEIIRADLGQGRILDPITQAELFRDHIEVEGLTRNEICQRYGLSRSQLSHSLRLLQLDPIVREWVRAGRLSAGKAKVLVGLNPGDQRRISTLAIENSLSTRQVEGETRNARSNILKPCSATNEPAKDSNVRQLEIEVSDSLGNPIAIEWDKSSSVGEVRIRYFSLEELQAITDRLQRSSD